MAGAIKQITAHRRIKIEENARYDNDLLLQTGGEKVEAVGDGLGKALKIEPAVLEVSICVSTTSHVVATHR